MPRNLITDGQVVEMVWCNMQCIYHKCPLLVFRKQLAEEVNLIFEGEQ
jgi:hypothetical protein